MIYFQFRFINLDYFTQDNLLNLYFWQTRLFSSNKCFNMLTSIFVISKAYNSKYVQGKNYLAGIAGEPTLEKSVEQANTMKATQELHTVTHKEQKKFSGLILN